jgi:hypothetical protein
MTPSKSPQASGAIALALERANLKKAWLDAAYRRADSEL